MVKDPTGDATQSNGLRIVLDLDLSLLMPVISLIVFDKVLNLLKCQFPYL